MASAGAVDTLHFRSPTGSAAHRGESHKGEVQTMRNALALAFVIIAVAPLIGIWRGHVWAKSKGMVLRKPAVEVERTTSAA